MNVLSEVCVDDEGLVVVTEVVFPCELDLHHPEFVLRSSSGCCHVEVDCVDVDDHKLRQTLTATEGFELVLPVSGRVNLVGSHCVDINNMHRCSHLVDQDKRSDAS